MTAEPRTEGEAGDAGVEVRRPKIGTVAVLLAGRGAYRAALYGSGIGLLAIWGSAEFARYAAAIGAVGWLTLLVSSGPEKAALALIPRPGGASLRRLFIPLAVAPPALLLIAWLTATVLGADSAARYLAAGLATGGLGCCTVLVALYRLRGTPLADPAAYATVAAGFATAVGLAFLTGAGPEFVLTLLAFVPVGVAVVLVTGLLREPPVERPSRAEGLAALRAAVVLGTSELLGAVSVSVVYAWFAIAGDAEQTSLFYVLMVVANLLTAACGYLLRIVQPQVVVWLLRIGVPAGRRWAVRWLGWTLGVGTVAATGLLVASVLNAHRVVLLVAVVVVEVALFVASTIVLVVLENLDALGRRWSAASAITQLGVVTVVGWWLVPAAGAFGAVAVFVIGELARTAVLRLMVTRQAE